MGIGTYNKRMKGNWNQGKSAKGDSSERMYAKSEIKQQLKEAEESYLQPYKKSKRKRNEKARLEYRIKWYEEFIARHKGRSDSLSSWLRSDLAKAKKQYEEKFGRKESK